MNKVWGRSKPDRPQKEKKEVIQQITELLHSLLVDVFDHDTPIVVRLSTKLLILEMSAYALKQNLYYVTNSEYVYRCIRACLFNNVCISNVFDYEFGSIIGKDLET